LTMAERSHSSRPSVSSTTSPSTPSTPGSSVRGRNSIASPRRPGANENSLNEASEKALLIVLLGAGRFEKHHSRVYNRDPVHFGLPGSSLRTQVVNRRKYLERIRAEKPRNFYEICLYHGLSPPVPPLPPTETIEFAADSTMSANRHRRRESKNEGA
jgi:hypothetical protein